MKNILCIIILLLPLKLFSQGWQWSKQIGGPGIDHAFVGYVDEQHNSYLYGQYALPWITTNFDNCYIGNDTLFGSSASFIAKYDQNGNIIWIRNCTSPGHFISIVSFVYDRFNQVFYISGIYNTSCSIDTVVLSASNNSAFLAKLDENGNCLWAKNVGAHPFSTTIGTALTTDALGNVFFGGVTDYTITIDTSIVTPGSFIAKYNANGDNLWAKTKINYSNSMVSLMYFKQLIWSDNKLYAIGHSQIVSLSDSIKVDNLSVTNQVGTGYGLIQMDNDGNSDWIKLEGFPHSSIFYPQQMDVDVDGNFYCVGNFIDTITISSTILIANNNRGNGFVSKYDQIGNLIYVKQLLSSDNIGAFGIKTIIDKSFFITGYFCGQSDFGGLIINSNTLKDLFVSHYNSNGNLIGVDNAGTGIGTSIGANESGVYISGAFPEIGTYDSIAIGSNSFTTYGLEDVVFAKHDMITGIDFEERFSKENSLTIYANPNKGSFRLKVPEDFVGEQLLLLRIFDSTGKLIRQQTLNMNESSRSLDIFDEAKGIYSVTLSNQRKVYSGKMIVE